MFPHLSLTHTLATCFMLLFCSAGDLTQVLMQGKCSFTSYILALFYSFRLWCLYVLCPKGWNTSCLGYPLQSRGCFLDDVSLPCLRTRGCELWELHFIYSWRVFFNYALYIWFSYKHFLQKQNSDSMSQTHQSTFGHCALLLIWLELYLQELT